MLLARPLAKSNSSIDRVKAVISASRITKFEVLEVEEGGPLGIETAKYGTAINTFIDSAMNANAEWLVFSHSVTLNGRLNTILVNVYSLWNLRGEVVKRLLEKVDFKTDDMDATGEEFEATLQAQATLEAYMAAYTDAVGDRREILTEGVRPYIYALIRQSAEDRVVSNRPRSFGRLRGKSAKNAKLKQQKR